MDLINNHLYQELENKFLDIICILWRLLHYRTENKLL
jgi:hypothetical protein